MEEKFILQLIKHVRESSLYALKTNLLKPSGRKPREKDLLLSKWYTSLSDSDREYCNSVICESIDEAIFGLLCILDRVRILDDITINYSLSKQKDSDFDNTPTVYLHDLYNLMISQNS